MQNDGEPWEQVIISLTVIYYLLVIIYHVIKINDDLIRISYIKFQHPAEIVIEHHKQIPICQIEDKHKTE